MYWYWLAAPAPFAGYSKTRKIVPWNHDTFIILNSVRDTYILDGMYTTDFPTHNFVGRERI